MKNNRIYNCLVWGGGDDYNRILNQLKFEELKENLKVLGVVVKPSDRVENYLDGFEIFSPDEIKKIPFDYIIITSSKFYAEIADYAVNLGTNLMQLINGRAFLLPNFDFGEYIRLIENRITILSDDCWGGNVYHELFMPFFSPLINIDWKSKQDFIRFMQKPKKYLSCPLTMVREANLRNNQWAIASLGAGNEQVRMDLVHSISFIHAKKMWDRRISRVNLDNLFIKLSLNPLDEHSEEYLDVFSKLEGNKVCFFSKETSFKKDVVYLQRFEHYNKTSHIVDCFCYDAYIRNMPLLMKSINLIKLLNGDRDFLREYS